MDVNTLTTFDDSATGWRRAFYAFLAEKEQHSGSSSTVESYSRMLQDFLGRLGRQPDLVTAQDVFVSAHGPGVSGKQPSPITIGSRIACVSSFYRFLIRMDIAHSNPCDKLQRPKVEPSPPRVLSAGQVHQLLTAVPNSPIGLRDRAITLTLVLTGRRRAEVLGVKVGDLSIEGECTYYAYHGKGGKRGRRELPRPAVEAVHAALAALGLNGHHAARGVAVALTCAKWQGATSGTFYGNLQRYFRKAGVTPAGVRSGGFRLLPSLIDPVMSHEEWHCPVPG